MSVAFVGTSYLALCEEEFTDGQWLDPVSRFSSRTNMVRALSYRFPEHTLYNCSENAHGTDLYSKRIHELIERYDPDVFVIEITDGERYTLHFDDEYYHNYDLHFPVQIWENGNPQNLNEEHRDVATPVLDQGHAVLNDLNKFWNDKNVPAMFTEKEWNAYRRIVAQLRQGLKSRHSDLMAVYKLIDHYLKSKGKEVFWFKWLSDANTIEVPENFQCLQQNTSMVEWAYYLDNNKRTDSAKKYEDNFNKYCYDNGAHVHSQHLAKLSRYFDEIFTKTTL